jgi:hypothetical protein
MSRFFLFFITILLLSFSSFADKEKIDEIYTEATGNNPYEAKIKAIDKAMFRAFLLLSDKHLIDDENLKKVPRDELKELFTDITIQSEDMRIYLSGSSYTGIIGFTFSPAKVNQLVQKYSSDRTKEKFLNALVIPVFKINNIIFLDKDNRKWISTWRSMRSELSDNKLYVSDYALDLKDKITTKNLLKLEYDDFMELLPYKLFNNVIISVAEFFTDRGNGSTYLKVKNIIISPNKKSEEVINFDLPSDRDSLTKFVPKVIQEFSAKYGEPKNQEFANAVPEESENVIDSLINSEKRTRDKYYIFLMEINYAQEIDEIQKKLHSIKDISRFNIESHYELGFKVRIFTDLDMITLADRLYYNGLSFYYNQYQNPVLINIPDEKK